MTTLIYLQLPLLFTVVHAPELTAAKWFNFDSRDLRESKTRVVMFVDASSSLQIDQAISLHKKLGPFSSFMMITPEQPNRVERILRRHRIRFPVGAGSRAHLAFGVKTFPSVLLYKPGSSEITITNPDDFVLPASSLPVEVQAAIDRMYAEDSIAHYSLDSLRKLAETFGRSDPARFLQVCDYLLSLEPPTGQREPTLQDRIRWKGQIYHLRHMVDPQIKEKQSVDTPLIHAMKSIERDTVQSVLPVNLNADLATKSEEQIVADYTAQLSTEAIPSLVRQSYLTALAKLSKDQQRGVLLRILPKETDPALRQMIVCQIHDACGPGDRGAIDVLQRELETDRNYRWSRPAIEEVLNYLQNVPDE